MHNQPMVALQAGSHRYHGISSPKSQTEIERQLETVRGIREREKRPSERINSVIESS